MKIALAMEEPDDDPGRPIGRNLHMAPTPREFAVPIVGMPDPVVLQRYQAALEQLREDQQTAVVMRLEMGYGYEEIAATLELPSGSAARSLIALAIVQLARIMAETGGT